MRRAVTTSEKTTMDFIFKSNNPSEAKETFLEPMGNYGYRLPQDITTQGPVRCLGPWGQCYKPGDMMMVHNHLTKTKNKLS